MELIEQIINPRQWVPFFFGTKITGAPHEDELGWINPFSTTP
jgi:hypothetical protein